MRSHIILLWVAMFLVGISPLCAQTEASSIPLASDKQCLHWADSVLSTMSQSEKAGQLVVATLSARTSSNLKKPMQTLVKTYKIGGLLFLGGDSEEQAILINVARKNSRIPVMVVYDGDWGSSILQNGNPVYPRNSALACIGDDKLVEASARETARQFGELGVKVYLEANAGGDPSKQMAQKHLVYKRALEESGIVPMNAQLVQQASVKNVQKVIASIQSELSSEELDNRCRQVLMHKYAAGLKSTQPQLQVSGMSHRIFTEDAQALAVKARRSAVTVLNNYFDILPLTSAAGDVAVLSIGDKETDDAAFVEALGKNVGVAHFYLPWGADDATRQDVIARMANYRRIVLSISGSSYINYKDAEFLEDLKLQAPLVYVFFTPQRPLQSLAQAIAKSSAVVWAHSAEDDLQQYVVDVLFAKVTADGKASVEISKEFPEGTGCVIKPGMKAGKIIPEDYGLKSYILCGVDSIAQKGVTEGAYPGCRVLVWKDGHPVYDKGFGTHSDADSTSVRPTDLFDLASLTKTTSTLLAVMKLYDEGKLKLDDKISQYVPVLYNTDKRDITIREVLFHESGLPPYIRFYMDIIDPNSVHGPYSQSWEDQWHHTQVSEHGFYCSDFKFKSGMISANSSSTHTLHVADGMWLNKSFISTILQKIAKCDMGSKRFVYSDLGFVLLQQVVENIVKKPMDAYLSEVFYAPMGLQRTMFLPLTKYGKEEIMPTVANDFFRRQDLCGYAQDETAACLGGVAGNAGLFSTAEEVAKIYQMLLNGGELGGKRYLSEATCRLFTTEQSSISRRGLGFDKPDVSAVKHSPCAASAPKSVYGHTGFTGTCAWADPENKTVYVFLSNALYPNVWNIKLGEMHIETGIQELIYKSLE